MKRAVGNLAGADAGAGAGPGAGAGARRFGSYKELGRKKKQHTSGVERWDFFRTIVQIEVEDGSLVHSAVRFYSLMT